MSNELPPETTAIVEMLGRLDALFWPRRGDFVQEAAQVRSELRCDWRTKGLSTRSAAASTNERKLEEQLWRGLERDGMVTIAAAAGRRTHVRLTFLGEQTARYLCATGNVLDGWDYFEAIAEMFDLVSEAMADEETPDPRFTYTGGRALSEAYIAGCTPWQSTPEQSEELTWQMFSLLPFLCRGWITASGDSDGRYWLSLTDEGRDAHAAGCPVDPCPDVRLVKAASDLYEQKYEAYSVELDGMTPRQGAPVIIPRPVGINWGGHSETEHAAQ